MVKFPPSPTSDSSVEHDNDKGVDEDEAKHEPSPLDPRQPSPAGAFSRLTYSWVGPLMARGAAGTLNEATLWAVSPDDAAEPLSARVLEFWRQEQRHAAEAKESSSTAGPRGVAKRSQPSEASLLRSTVLAFVATGKHRAGLFLPALTAVRIMQALSLGRLVSALAGEAESAATWGWATALVVLGLLGFQLHHAFFFVGWRTGMQLRTALVGVVFDKSMRLSLAGLGAATVEQVRCSLREHTATLAPTVHSLCCYSGRQLGFERYRKVSNYRLVGSLLVGGPA